MPSVGIDTAHFFGLIFGLLVYGTAILFYPSLLRALTSSTFPGCYLVVFGITIHVLLGRNVKSRVVLGAMFLLLTLSMSYYGAYSVLSLS